MLHLPQSTMNTKRSFFRHQKLATDEIRLFRLVWDKSPQDGISCQVQSYKIDVCPTYIAVSYMWGPYSFQDPYVIVDERQLPIRKNLFDFLNLLRMNYESGWMYGVTDLNGTRRRDMHMWCDQICIDQSNIEERNQQVALMSQIYNNALETMVWLGFDDSLAQDSEPAEASEPGLHLHRTISRCGSLRSTRGSFVSRYDTIEHRDQRESEQILQAALRRPYWLRLWIVQEIWFSSDLNFVFDHHWIPGHILEAFVLQMDPESSDGLSSTMPTELRHTRNLIMNRKHSTWNKKQRYMPKRQSLSHLLFSFGQLKCQDPRDRVYGLMSLVPKSKRVKIDYSLTVRDLFFEVVFKVISDESDSHHVSGFLFFHFAMDLKKSLRLLGTAGSSFTYEAIKDFVYAVEDAQRTMATKGMSLAAQMTFQEWRQAYIESLNQEDEYLTD